MKRETEKVDHIVVDGERRIWCAHCADYHPYGAHSRG